MVRSRYARGTIEVRSWYGPGAVEVRSWCGRGTLVVRSRYGLGAVEVRSWYGRGTLVVRFRFASGSVRFVNFSTGDTVLLFHTSTIMPKIMPVRKGPICNLLNNKPRVVVTDFRLHHNCNIILWLHSLSGGN